MLLCATFGSVAVGSIVLYFAIVVRPPRFPMLIQDGIRYIGTEIKSVYFQVSYAYCFS